MVLRIVLTDCLRQLPRISCNPTSLTPFCLKISDNKQPLGNCTNSHCIHHDSGQIKIIKKDCNIDHIKCENWTKKGPHVSLISNEEIRHRQTRLVGQMCHQDRDRFILIIPAAPQTAMAGTEIPNYNLKQSSDFIYLTGLNLIKSLDSVLVLIGGKEEPTKSILFTSLNDARKDIWLGPDLVNQTRRPIGGLFDEVKSNEQLVEFIDRYTKMGYRQGATRLLIKTLTNKRIKPDMQDHLASYFQPITCHSYGSNDNICDITTQLDKLKFIKSKSEIDAMRRACYIGARSMFETIKWARRSLLNHYVEERPKLNECQLVGRFEYETRLRGSTKLTFWPVCASQNKATTIHYGTNDQDINLGDWILMDAGCEEFDGYNSDITRTFPTSPTDSSLGKASRLRYELFEALLSVHNRLLMIAANDRPCLDELYRYMLSFISDLLYEFKPFINGNNMTKSDFFSLATRYCPHHVSHYLGLDLHDTPTVSRSTRLIQGVCFTIEPGLYFPNSDLTLKDEFKGIGFRIEDDCIVNEHDQFEVLTRHIDHDLSFNR